jgi:hypothetical protein
MNMSVCGKINDETEFCKCIAADCYATMRNESTQTMEDCWMNVCFPYSKRSLPMDRLLPLTIVYTIIFIVGLVGNLTTCIVIRKHPVLQTQTNRYLLNLALADLLTLTVGLPFEICK